MSLQTLPLFLLAVVYCGCRSVDGNCIMEFMDTEDCLKNLVSSALINII